MMDCFTWDILEIPQSQRKNTIRVKFSMPGLSSIRLFSNLTAAFAWIIDVDESLCKPLDRGVFPLLFFNPYEQFYEAERDSAIDDVLASLTECEETVLRLRFGLGDGYPRTLEEVGSVIYGTRERVRQIEAKALRKMRHPTRAAYLRRWLYEGMVKTKGEADGKPA